MLELYHRGKISLEKIAEKLSHAVADCFRVKERGYIREGFYADFAIVNLNAPWKVSKDNLYYKCGWSPFEGVEFHSAVTHTFVCGLVAFLFGLFVVSFFGL